MSCLWETSAAVKPTRTCFLDFPIGCPAGKPHAAEQQLAILRAALHAAPEFVEPWPIRALPFEWAADGSRAWEDELSAIYRRGVGTVTNHMSRHSVSGAEDLAGQEREFAIRCQC